MRVTSEWFDHCRSGVNVQHLRLGAVNILIDGALFGACSVETISSEWPDRRALTGLNGDASLVLWEDGAPRIWLVRTALSSRDIFYSFHAGKLLTSDIIYDLPNDGLNLAALADWIAAPLGSGIASMFNGVARLAPGTAVEMVGGSVRSWRHCDYTSIPIAKNRTLAESAEMLRYAFDRAVADRADRKTKVGSLLSSGRDSSITTAAVAAVRGTGFPGFTASSGPDVAARCRPLLVDEAPAAAQTAKDIGVAHKVVVARKHDFCRSADESYAYLPQPFGNPLAAYWWDGTMSAVQSFGITDLFTGGVGNLALSDGGPEWLPDLFDEDGPIAWMKVFCSAARFKESSLLSLLNKSFGSRLPKWVASIRLPRTGTQLLKGFLRGELRQAVEVRVARDDARPPRSSRALGAALLNDMELADPATERRFGLTVHDPTADRRVIEAILSNPARLMASPYDRRFVLEAAFGDRLPSRVLRPPRRAYQCMDWNLGYDVGSLHVGLDRYRRSTLACAYVDLDAIARNIDHWPKGPLLPFELIWQGDATLRALSLAAFLSRADRFITRREMPQSA